VSVRIYVEGGPQGSAKSNCRQAFRALFEKVVPHGSFTVIASGDRGGAFKDFCLALEKHRDDYVLLLVDADEEVTSKPWEHLRSRQGDQWRAPEGSQDEQAHLMVQMMESWFLADKEMLSEYYGKGFVAGSLPRRENIELIAKKDVLTALANATRNSQKGEYHKTRHGFDLIECLSPDLLRTGSKHADRLFVVLERETRN